MTVDVKRYANAEITPTMDAFADYLIAEVYGGTLPKGMHEATFRKAVALGGSTRGHFQKSEMWKSDPRNYLDNVEANRVKKIEEAKARAAATAKKSADRLAALEAKLVAARTAAEAKVAPAVEEATAAA